MTKYLKEVNGRFHFAPSPAMRKAGFRSKALGTDRVVAEKYADSQAQEWKKIQQLKIQDNALETKGDFYALIGEFKKDPTWYLSRAAATQEEMNYAFKYIEGQFGKYPVREGILQPKHARAFYNKLRIGGDETGKGSVHKARKVMKWFRRLLKYAVHIGMRETNPAADLEMEAPKGRNQIWQPAEVDTFIAAALASGVAESGNEIPLRPSLALAVQIAYDTTLPEQDILALQWSQFDGEGLKVRQIKERGGRELWIPLHPRTLEMMSQLEKNSTYIIVSEETKQPYADRRTFSRIFSKFRKRAGIRDELRFNDLRRTAMTEMGDAGVTNAEMVSHSGHSINSRVLDVYVKPGKGAAKNAAKKRWGMENK